MSGSIEEQVVQDLKDGLLTEQKLREAFEKIRETQMKQKLLYLFTRTNEIHSQVISMAYYANGNMSDGSVNPDEWPYKTVAGAIDDGWSVIHFPRAESIPDKTQRYIPYEFILEKKERSESH